MSVPIPSPAALARRLESLAEERLRLRLEGLIQDRAQAEVMAYDEAIYSRQVRETTVRNAEEMAYSEALRRERRATHEAFVQAKAQRQAYQALVTPIGEAKTAAAERYQRWIDSADEAGVSLDAYLDLLRAQLKPGDVQDHDQRIATLRQRAAAQHLSLVGYLILKVSQRRQTLREKSQDQQMQAALERQQQREHQQQNRRTELLHRARDYREQRKSIAKTGATSDAPRRHLCPRPDKAAYSQSEIGRLAAQLHLESLQADGFGLDVQVYVCRGCSWLHVGNSRDRLTQRVRSALSRRTGTA